MTTTGIMGGGFIGCATAYYLSETQGVDPASIHIVEAAPEFFASASGKAAGFLAADCTLKTMSHMATRIMF